jgi:hypothetical protein
MKNKIFLMAIASIALASCSNDEVVNQQQDNDGIAFRTIMNNSRASETTTAKLAEFWVTARTDGNSEEFTDQHYKASGSYFVTDGATKTWPTYDVNFFAVAPQLTLNVDNARPRIMSYKPALKIKNQADLIYATNKGSRTDFTDAVPLKFNHAMTQIIVYAKNTNTAYNVHVKGYRIGYVTRQGTFVYPEAANIAENLDQASWTQANGEWTTLTYTKDENKDGNNYSSEFRTAAITLTGDAQKIDTESGEGSAMIIPQSGAAWDPNNWDPKGNNTYGRYLAVLVQINYRNADGSDGGAIYPSYSRTSADAPKTEITETTLTTSDGTTTTATTPRVSYAGLPFYYGYAAVPISDEWEAGKCYTYVLDFSNGCGYVDPEKPFAFNPDTDGDGEPDEGLDEDGDGVPDDEDGEDVDGDGEPDGDGIPDGIQVEPGTDGDEDGDGVKDDTDLDDKDGFDEGDQIIGHEIKFKVIVSDWVEAIQADRTSTAISTGMNTGSIVTTTQAPASKE